MIKKEIKKPNLTVKKNNLNQVNSISREIFINTSIHGLPNLIRSSNNCIKLLWIICFITSNTLCAIVIVKCINNYLNFEIVTQISEVYEKSSEFPALSFCNTQGSFDKLPVLACTFNRRDCMSYFDSFEDADYGKCFRFNTGTNSTTFIIKTLNMTTGGVKYGLKLDLNLTNQNNTDFNELALFIHNKSVKTNSLRNRGYRLLSGSLNYFEIHRVIDEKLDEPYNDCYKNVEQFRRNRTLVDYFLNTGVKYNRIECHRYCRNLHVMQNSTCNCTQTFQNIGDCSKNKKSKPCYENFVTEFLSKNVFEICSEYCPEECKIMSYSVITFSQFIPGMGEIDSNNTFEIPKVYRNYSEVKKYYISIRAYYEELAYTYIGQSAKSDVIDLISSIGGTLGLFLGMSFLSFIEIVQYFVEIIFSLARNNFK